MSGWSRPVPAFESSRPARVPWRWLTGLSVAALGLQTLLPTLQPALGLLNLPFVTTLNLMLWCRSAASTMLLGALIGCVYDGLTHGPVGLHGLAYTICGYLVAQVGPHLRRDHALVLGSFFAAAYLTYEFLFGVIRSALVSAGEATDLPLRLVLAAIHAGAGLFVFTMLSKAAGKP